MQTLMHLPDSHIFKTILYICQNEVIAQFIFPTIGLPAIRLQCYPIKDVCARFSHKHTVMYSVSMYAAYLLLYYTIISVVFFLHIVLFYCVSIICFKT